MKITSVEIWDTESSLKPTWPTWHPVIVRINTDEGISGLGEVGLAFGTGHSAGAGYVKNLAEDFLIGNDPMKTESIWEEMFRKTFWAQGGGPVVYGGMSAVDIACWDIKGKVMGQPVYQLLGGKTNEILRTYASQIQFGWDYEKVSLLFRPEEYAEAAKTAVDEGYDCIKVDPVMADENGRPIYNLNRILTNNNIRIFYQRIKAVREKVGNDIDIIVELHGHPNATSAIQIIRTLEEFNCMCYEEAVQYCNVDLQSKVSYITKVPMTAGERIYTRWGYRQYLEKQVFGMIQPDICLVGGITECKKICDIAHIYDVTVQVHVCGSPIATAA